MAVLLKPAAGTITRSFGRQRDGSWHWGTDRGWGNGATVYAMRDGIVTQVLTLSDYGRIVKVDHWKDADGVHVETRYCHLSSQAVKLGDVVTAGQKLGMMGSSGSLTDQIHLHSELILNGSRSDEAAYTTPAATAAPAIQPESDSDMKIIKNSTTGELWVSAPGVFVLFPTGSYANAEAVLAQAYGLTALFPNDVLTARAAALLAAPPSGGGGGGLTAAQDAKLTAIPSSDAATVDDAELAQAETSGAQLVIDALTPQITAVKNAVLGLGISHS